MMGYEDLVTDEKRYSSEGHNGLGAGRGTYYLTETQTQSGYALFPEDICFTIGKDGTVTLNNGADTGSTIARTEDEEPGRQRMS